MIIQIVPSAAANGTIFTGNIYPENSDFLFLYTGDALHTPSVQVEGSNDGVNFATVASANISEAPGWALLNGDAGNQPAVRYSSFRIILTGMPSSGGSVSVFMEV